MLVNCAACVRAVVAANAHTGFYRPTIGRLLVLDIVRKLARVLNKIEHVWHELLRGNFVRGY
jgi:hypothetical protein